LLLGLYHDDVGGHGDYFSGEYTDPNGKVQTGTSTATATDDSKASQTSRTATSVRATSTGSGSITSAAGASASSTIVSATSQAGGDLLRVGANVGFMGLVAGLIL
jgi:hypothetical protein